MQKRNKKIEIGRKKEKEQRKIIQRNKEKKKI